MSDSPGTGPGTCAHFIEVSASPSWGLKLAELIWPHMYFVIQGAAVLATWLVSDGTPPEDALVPRFPWPQADHSMEQCSSGVSMTHLPLQDTLQPP